MKAGVVLAGTLLAVLLISGCVQTGLTLNDFQYALKGLEIDGVKPVITINPETQTLYGKVEAGTFFLAIWDLADNIQVSIISSTNSNEAEQTFEASKNILTGTVGSEESFSVSIFGEEITKIKNTLYKDISYIWVHDKFVIEINVPEDNDMHKPIAEAIIDAYK